MRDIKSHIIITCKKGKNIVFHIQIEMDEFWFVQTQQISEEIEKDLGLGGDEILKMSLIGNKEDLSNFAGKLNLQKIASQGISSYYGEVLGIFYYNIYKYSLFANLVDLKDNTMIEIMIKMTAEYQFKFLDDINMKLQFLAYLRKNISEISS